MNPQSSVTNNSDLQKCRKEKCIFCKQDTPYKISQPINIRYFYIDGCGQLCSKCYYKHAYSLGTRNDIIDTIANINNLQISLQ